MHMAAIYEQSDNALTLLPRIPASSYLFLPDLLKQTKLAPSQMRYATNHCILPQGNVSGWECLPNSVYISLNIAGDKSWWKKPESKKSKKPESKEGNKHGTVLTSYEAFANLLLLQAIAGFSPFQLVKRICLQGRRPGFDSWVGNPLQYSCLENPMDRGPWQATVYGITRVRHNYSD